MLQNGRLGSFWRDGAYVSQIDVASNFESLLRNYEKRQGTAVRTCTHRTTAVVSTYIQQYIYICFVYTYDIM